MRRRKRKGFDEKILFYKNYVINGMLNQVPPNEDKTIKEKENNCIIKTSFDYRNIVKDDIYNNIQDNYKGKWSQVFGNDNPIYIEVGSGRGQFITTLAKNNPNINYIALEIKEEVLIRGVEKAIKYDLDNIKFIWGEVEFLENYFADGELNRIYINFCDPWPKKKNAKRRLTSSKFLDLYLKKLKNHNLSEIHFKTDNRQLFEFTLNEFLSKNWNLKNISLDLANSDLSINNVTTEYEDKFMELKMPIYRLEAFYIHNNRD